MLQNSLLLGINCIFLVFLLVHKPYANKLYQTQALTMSVSTVLICSLNYGFIDVVENDSVFYTLLKVTSAVVHGVSFALFFGILVYSFILEKKKPKIQTHNIDNDNIQLVERRNPSSDSLNKLQHVDSMHNPEYKREKRTRFAKEFNRTLTGVV